MAAADVVEDSSLLSTLSLSLALLLSLSLSLSLPLSLALSFVQAPHVLTCHCAESAEPRQTLWPDGHRIVTGAEDTSFKGIREIGTKELVGYTSFWVA